MVITKLYGGLGNQMFQYAAGRTLSVKLRTNLYLDLSWFESIKGSDDVTQRTYELDVFGIRPKKFSIKDSISSRVQAPKIFKEVGLGYHPEFNDLSGNVVLDGYWQSYKYFDFDRDQVIEDFRFPTKISSYNKKVLKLIDDSQSVSLHVRRGDYANVEHTNKYHGLIPVRFYEQAVARLNKHVANFKLFIFSDDPKWCEENLKFYNREIVYVNQNTSLKGGVEDMRLMSACKHNIIANSSFSWWAAWLNPNPQKTVYAPKAWFKDVDAHLEDRLPKGWIII